MANQPAVVKDRLQQTARGFRNRRNLVHYFHCGGLDLAPEATKQPEAQKKAARRR
ncbi:MAG: hypothetical protein ABSH44_05005 [Bryobacteraceae bacterium]